jgi:hypothetical protein
MSNKTGRRVGHEYILQKSSKMYLTVYVTPSATNLEEEKMVDAPGNDGNTSMSEQVKLPNPWRNMMMMTSQETPLVYITYTISLIFRENNCVSTPNAQQVKV